MNSRSTKAWVSGLWLLFIVSFSLNSVWIFDPAAAQEEGKKTLELNSAPESDAKISPTAIHPISNLNYSPEALSPKQRAAKNLLQESFTYRSDLLVDPFVSFLKPPDPSPPDLPLSDDEDDAILPPELQRPLTPLQKMNIGEIERGLKAIVWGELGRKALIQDSAGKGYIVSVGTPAAGGQGVITQIFDDRLIVQQEVWDSKSKRMIPKNEVVKLRKQAAGE
jgi:Tfp pilus assembly protein PilP